MDPDRRLHELTERARKHYCLVNEHGHESEIKLRTAVAALEGHHSGDRAPEDLPSVPGVPRLRGSIDRIDEIAQRVRKELPMVEADPRLHALSFVNPLLLAVDHLGIAISPLVARYVRRALRGSLSFAGDADPERVFRGLKTIRWVHRQSPAGGGRSKGDRDA